MAPVDPLRFAVSAMPISRRRFLACSASIPVAAALRGVPAQAQTVPEAFSFDALSERMQRLSREPYQEPVPMQGVWADLRYDGYQKIRFRPDRARWIEDGVAFRLNAFHPGWLFNVPVRIHEITDGMSREMTFTAADFEYDDPEVAAHFPPDMEMPGVAGLRVHTPLNRPDVFDDLCVFQGASYFRALARGTAYGLSARGLALNTGMPEGEEFPRFTEIWMETPRPGDRSLTMFASLDSPSVTGAFRFVITPGESTRMEVTARIYMRADVRELGVAPLTSMFLFGGADMGTFDDYRAAVHDSDALVLQTGSGDSIYRVLSNPPRVANSYLGTVSPRSFGLVQRQRGFEDYLDAQAQYEKRPTLMVEPIGEWGAGAVRLVEIPSDLEIYDNVVTYWVPEGERRAGDTLEFSYRLHWGLNPPGAVPVERARVVRTLVGEGGVSGMETKSDTRKFVIDFAGGLLDALPGDAEVEPVVEAIGGEIAETVLFQVGPQGFWRLVIEVRASPDAVVELTARIAGYDQTLTETWAYQWIDA
ncbi:glucan biosynthesis protein G [Sulfitobacter sp. LCG007]